VQILCVSWKELEGFLEHNQGALAAGIFDLINQIAPQKGRV
jgi:hypothetical protein